jgi:carbon-monoxide dehydrogenase iron sulfur subunit
MKRVYIREQFCIGCHLCEVYCQLQHSHSRDIIKAFKKEASRPLSGARVEERGSLALSVRCQHCQEPLCLYACPAGALNLDAGSGLIVYNPERCIGCWSCVLACPLGAIKRDADAGRVFKCDLCPGEETPACVANCPNEALVYMEVPEDNKDRLYNHPDQLNKAKGGV